jgi:hypothetical protein
MRTKILVAATSLLAAAVFHPSAAVADHPPIFSSDREPAQAAPQPARLSGGAITLGETPTTEVSCFFTSPYGITLEVEDPTRPSYRAPFSGVLTSYSTFASSASGNVRALVLKDGADATHKIVTGKSEQHVAIPSVLNTVPVRIPMQAGERLALGLSANGLSCSKITGAPDVSRVAESFNADSSTSFAYTNAPFPVRPNISAVLEPDVDSDGFGDVSQDHCPQLASEQLPCPAPDTIVTKAPKKSSTKRRVRIEFTAGVPGAVFTCMIDKLPAVSCASPLRKKLKPGKHTVVITAASSVGIADPTPATVKFKIKKM